MEDEFMTEDERRGIAWWNDLSTEDRRLYLALAGSAAPSDAWAAHKARMMFDGTPTADLVGNRTTGKAL